MPATITGAEGGTDCPQSVGIGLGSNVFGDNTFHLGWRNYYAPVAAVLGADPPAAGP
jgi:hypothetical protein